MNLLKKIFFTTFVVFGLIGIWFWADNNDYFQANYNDLTIEQQDLFKWRNGDNEKTIKERYRQHFTDKTFTFPRQRVDKVKIFKNIPVIGLLTSKTLKQIQIENFVAYCNDTTNFHWGETTWKTSDSEYYFKLYDDNNKVIGKIYFCLNKCGMTSARPFCSTMKFGGLSESGQKQIEKFIDDKTNWD